MKKFLILFSFCLLLVSCGKITNNVIVSKKSIDNSNLYGSDKIDEDFKKYMKVFQSFDLTGCKQFTGFRNEKCKLTILSSLSKIDNISDCSGYNIQDIKNECKKIVYKKKYICDKLNDLEEKKSCLDNKYYDKALKEKNSYWCLYIEDIEQRKYCQEDIKKIKFFKKNNKFNNSNSYCGVSLLGKKCPINDKKCQIKQLFQKYYVSPSLKEKNKICKKIENIDKSVSVTCFDNYYKDKSLVYMDYKMCGKIQDKSIKYKCEQETIYKQAVENIDNKLCNKLDKKKNQCLDEVLIRDITKKRLTDSSLCKKMHTDEYKKKCYQSILKNY